MMMHSKLLTKVWGSKDSSPTFRLGLAEVYFEDCVHRRAGGWRTVCTPNFLDPFIAQLKCTISDIRGRQSELST